MTIKIIATALLLSCTTMTTQALSEREINIRSALSGVAVGIITTCYIEGLLDGEIDALARVIASQEANQPPPAELMRLAQLIKMRNSIIALFAGATMGTAAGFGTQALLNRYYGETSSEKLKRTVEQTIDTLQSLLK